MVILETCLLRVADTYAAEVEIHGGRSLARVATVVVNHSAFFDRLRGGQTCFVRNLQRVAEYFADAANWPTGVIPAQAHPDLAALGVSTEPRCTDATASATKAA